MAHYEAASFTALAAEAVGGFLDGAVAAAPADEEDLALGVTMDVRQRKLGGQRFSLSRRRAVICVCSLGLPVGWPHSSCSRPDITGYFPERFFCVPGGA